MVLNHLNKKQKIVWVISAVTVVILLLLSLVLVLTMRKDFSDVGESTSTSTTTITTTKISESTSTISESTSTISESTTTIQESTSTSLSETTTTENPDMVLFLSENQVLSLPFFQKVECVMEHVSLNNHFGLAGKVMIDGQERLLIGGFEKDFWFMRTEKGWEEVADSSYKRYMAAISNADSSSRELIVTGGSQDSSHFMEIFSDNIWRNGPDLPEPEGKHNHCQVTFQGKPYIIGGHVGNERNVRYKYRIPQRLIF